MGSIGYLRVSDDEASLPGRRKAVEDYAAARGLGPVDFVEAEELKPRGRAAAPWRTVRLDWLVEERCGPGDALIVPSLPTIARSMQQLHQVLTALRGRGASLHIVDRGIVVKADAVETKGGGEGGLTIGSAALFANFEREIMVAASKEALRARPGKDGQAPGRGAARDRRRV